MTPLVEDPEINTKTLREPELSAMLATMPINQHTFDEDNIHDEEECRLCILKNHAADCECRCGHCCERLILEATVEDARDEPRIAAECQPLRDVGPDVVGYFLNDKENDMACHFYDRERRLCTIYETRPLMCRVFNCDEERKSEELAETLCHTDESAE